MSAGVVFFPNKNLVNSQTFTSDGTFNVPENVDHIFVEAWGGGAGGAQGGGGNGGAGGNGGSYGFRGLSVTPGGTVSVQVGDGGTPASNGQNTVVGSLTFKGGRANVAGQAQGGGSGNDGQDSFTANGGSALGVGADDGGGGGAGRGNGADGGDGGGVGAAREGDSAASNTAAGGGGGADGIVNNTGGSGGSGHVIIYWSVS